MGSMDKFRNAAGAKATLDAAKKNEIEKAQVVALQNIRNENLIDNPQNGEDISQTLDLEESMRQNGFTDPMEVTDFGMENGKYMILSGHRRRSAGVKVFGADYAFPCIVRHFQTSQEVQNYTLMANSQRDSAKDPCLFCARYKMHEEYLESIDFKGSKREEIAKRLGISVQQADRYKQMNRVILPIWDMVRAEEVGMSSVVAMATHSEAEQMMILGIMQDALKKGETLTRDAMKKIIDGFRAGKKTWAEIADLPRDSGMPLNQFINTEPGETKGPREYNRNDEVRREDPLGAEYDAMQRDKADWERQQAEKAQNEELEEEAEQEDEDMELGEEVEENHGPSPKEKKLKLGAEIAKELGKLDTNLNGVWDCEDEAKAEQMISNMSSVARVLIDEMYRLAQKWEMAVKFEVAMEDVEEAMMQYK